MIGELVMDDQLDEEQDAAFEEPEDIPEANFDIAGRFLAFVRLTSRAGIGYWTSSVMDTLLSQTRPRRSSSSCSIHRPLLAVPSHITPH